jgi:hypothetical protein
MMDPMVDMVFLGLYIPNMLDMVHLFEALASISRDRFHDKIRCTTAVNV